MNPNKCMRKTSNWKVSVKVGEPLACKGDVVEFDL